MSFEILAGQGRTRDFTGQLFQADGVTGLTMNASDELRVKVGTGINSTPLLDLVSTAPTANGSSVTITNRVGPSPAAYSVRLAEGDMTMPQGTYDIEIIVVDSSESVGQQDKLADRGCLAVLAQMGGNVGL